MHSKYGTLKPGLCFDLFTFFYSVDRYQYAMACAGVCALNSFQIEYPQRQKQKWGSALLS